MASNPFKFEVDSLQRGLRELELREQHPLKVYRPMPQQLAIHESQASEVIVTGGKRCLPGWQEVYDPVAGYNRRICDIDGPFHVISRSPTNGNQVVAAAGKPFTKGREDFYEITLSNGQTFDATHNHQVLTTLGWISVGAAFSLQQECGLAPLVSSSASFPSGFPRDGRGSLQIVRDCRGGCFAYCHPCDEPLPLAEDICPESPPLLDGVLEQSCFGGLRLDDSERKPEYIHPCRFYDLPSTLCAQGQTSGHEASSGFQASCTTYSQAWMNGPELGQSLPLSYAHPHTGALSGLDPSHTTISLPLPSTPLEEPKEVIVTGMRYIGKHTVWDFEVAATGNYELCGVLHHNSGKTLATVMEFGSRVLGKPIYRPDGTPIKKRFRPPTPKNPRLYWVIGLDVQHIGQTLYHRLFSPGLGCDFRIIADGSGGWRAYNPNQDEEQYDKTILCPPMFGEHIIEPNSWHMESAAGNIFKSVRLLNGATICAYATTGDHPKQGDAVDGIWLDEDTANAEFLKEWQDRLSTRRGWFLWSVWPKVANEALIKTVERGRKYEDDGVEDPPIKILQLIGSENLYSDKKGVAEMLARMDDDDDEAHRDQGDITAFISGRQMYDFGTNIHVLRPTPDIEKPENPYTVLTKLLSLDKKYPSTWTRYLSIDPSHTRTAVLVGVVPPPEWLGVDMGDRLIIEGELVARKHTPSMLAQALQEALGPVTFEAFVMDQMIGRQTTVGADQTVFAAYEAEFRRRGLVSRLTGSGFMRGCADKSLRRRTVRRLLEPLDGGYPSLLVSNKCPQLIKEFFSYRKKEVKDHQGRAVPMDDPANERVHDCMAALEYLCQYVSERFRDATAYVEPAQARTKGSFAYHSAMAMQKKMQEQEQGGYAHMGPGERA